MRLKDCWKHWIGQLWSRRAQRARWHRWTKHLQKNGRSACAIRISLVHRLYGAWRKGFGKIGSIRTFFSLWSSLAKLQALLRQRNARRSAQELHRVFGVWRDAAACMRRITFVLSEFLLAHRTRTLLFAWRTWHSALASLICKPVHEVGYISRMRESCVSTVLERTRSRLVQFQASRRASCVRSTWRAWLSAAGCLRLAHPLMRRHRFRLLVGLIWADPFERRRKGQKLYDVSLSLLVPLLEGSPSVGSPRIKHGQLHRTELRQMSER